MLTSFLHFTVPYYINPRCDKVIVISQLGKCVISRHVAVLSYLFFLITNYAKLSNCHLYDRTICNPVKLYFFLLCMSFNLVLRLAKVIAISEVERRLIPCHVVYFVPAVSVY